MKQLLCSSLLCFEIAMKFLPSMKRGRTEDLGEAACAPTGTSGVHALDAEGPDLLQSVKRYNLG